MQFDFLHLQLLISYAIQMGRSQTDRFDNLSKKLKSSAVPIEPTMTTPPYYDLDETYKY